ncbi:YceD family protein [Salinicola aestuarinus]|uniref:YceD family protein n=1 Tax=Salinicola aestuarinus TaxID=1949082 RepID=UPI000DA19802|nr:YceD family protein [Salinicola aestuarinus]
MLTRRLPSAVEPYRLAANHERLEGLVALHELKRLADEVGEQQGDAIVTLQFSLDAQRRHLIDGELEANLSIPCRRCLEPMSVAVASEFQLAIVSSDASAAEVPSEYEPVLVRDEQLDLLGAIEDELILSLPQVVYHDEAECAVSREQLSSGELPEEESSSRTDNPFDALKSLKGKL